MLLYVFFSCEVIRVFTITDDAVRLKRYKLRHTTIVSVQYLPQKRLGTVDQVGFARGKSRKRTTERGEARRAYLWVHCTSSLLL